MEVVVTLDAPPVARGGHVRTLAAVQGSVESDLAATVPQAEIQHRYSYVLDGLAVKVPSSDLDRVQDMPGVTGVYPSVTYRSLRSSTPGFIGAPAVWGPTLKTAGQGVKIGIIDDGVNQTHPYFDPKGYKMPRGFPEGAEALHDAQGDRCARVRPALAEVEVRGPPVRPTELRACDPCGRHRRRQLPHQGGPNASVGGGAEGVHRQLQGAVRARRRVRPQWQLARDRGRDRGCRPRRDGRHQPVAGRGGDRSEPGHRRRAH